MDELFFLRPNGYRLEELQFIRLLILVIGQRSGLCVYLSLRALCISSLRVLLVMIKTRSFHPIFNIVSR